jgi:general secretion pathway protein C
MKTGLLSVLLANFLQKNSMLIQKMPMLAVVVLAALLTHQLALLTWALVPEDTPTLLWKPIATNNKNMSKINTEQLQKQHLFGEKSDDAQPMVQQTHAPKTRLNLKLVGIVAASEAKYSSVIIDSKGTQNSYFIDSKIDGTSAVITHIYQNRIILDVKGSNQTLFLDGGDDIDKQQKKTGEKSKSTKKSKRPSKRDVKTVNLDRQELLSDPGKLTDYIKISPVRKDGVVKGYRVKPGKNKTFFNEAGLKSGDLAVELNGVDLTDTKEAFTLMKEFPTMTDITLSVERDGQLHELYFSIP